MYVYIYILYHTIILYYTIPKSPILSIETHGDLGITAQHHLMRFLRRQLGGYTPQRFKKTSASCTGSNM